MTQNLFAVQLLDACRAQGLMLATAESCTGGMISAALTDVAGSSDVFDRGFVTYSYASKTDLLGVSSADLTSYGAVSQEVALAMASGALANSSADLSVAVTGVAGPGGSDSKPEGLVWIAVMKRGQSPRAFENKFGPLGRANVRAATVERALKLLLDLLAE